MGNILQKYYQLSVNDDWSSQTLNRYLRVGYADLYDEHTLAILFLADFVSDYVDPNNPKAKNEVQKYLKVSSEALKQGIVMDSEPLQKLRSVARQIYKLDNNGQNI